jgi:GNAT superfamily N-acetyltransferase
MIGDLSPQCLAEKLAPPRPLVRVAGALYAPPLPGKGSAWLAWPGSLTKRMLDRVEARARRDGAKTLTVGGPPGNYVTTGIDPQLDPEACAFFEAHGYERVSTHLDLVVRTRKHTIDAAAERCTSGDAVLPWIAEHFAAAWAMEAERALGGGGLFVLRGAGGGLVGFAAHSGNRAWEGRFGPVGVVPEARGAGAGRRLSATVLADLAARGHAKAVVPWVDAATAKFYRRFCEVVRKTEIVTLRRTLVVG